MGLFDKIKNQAQNAVSHTAHNTVRGATQAVSGAVASGVKNLQNKRETFTFQVLPQSLAELQALPEAKLDSPYATAALTIAALCAYETSGPQAVADMLNFLRGPKPLTPHDMQFMRDRLAGKGFKTFAYFEGSSPQNNYTPTQPYRVTVFDNPYSWVNEDSSQSSTGPVQYARLLMKSSGSDNERMISMRLKPSTNQWFLTDHQLLGDIRISAAADDWA